MTLVHRRTKEVSDRLSRIEGHIRGIRKMVDEDQDCSRLLLQIAAVRAALCKVGQIVLEDHMETCLVKAVKSRRSRKYLSELTEPLSQFLLQASR